MEKQELELYNEALCKYGVVNQKWMLIEECGELVNAFAKLNRGRATKQEIITELADVYIMVRQMALFWGLEDFYKEKERKLKRLAERLGKNY